MASNSAVANRSADSGWVTRLFSAQPLAPEYQELKFALHRKLLERINLEVLSSLGLNVSVRKSGARLPNWSKRKRRR